jgi:putative transposase
VSDKLGSYAVARREVIPEAMHDTARYANNRVEASHQTTRVRERGMRRFKSMLQAQRLLRVHAVVSNLFNLGRHLVAADHYRELRRSAFASRDGAVAI